MVMLDGRGHVSLTVGSIRVAPKIKKVAKLVKLGDVVMGGPGSKLIQGKNNAGEQVCMVGCISESAPNATTLGDQMKVGNENPHVLRIRKTKSFVPERGNKPYSRD